MKIISLSLQPLLKSSVLTFEDALNSDIPGRMPIHCEMIKNPTLASFQVSEQTQKSIINIDLLENVKGSFTFLVYL